ncbi:MAG: hypothetical protein HC881_18130, partial [Leptolyngbyaceae cyanobacterium SL_7_1]|nr:hypothetical protein [Leptolyngbyaceae cyanobacterium SL_7_1]
QPLYRDRPTPEPQSWGPPLPIVAVPVSTTAPPKDAISQVKPLVETALTTGKFAQALGHLQTIPPTGHGDRYQNWLQQATQGVLREAKATLGSDLTQAQPAELTLAIQTVRQIQPGQPYYGEAQRQIHQWSEAILAVAKQRAVQPNQGSSTLAAHQYHAAILAAKLVPIDQTTLYTDAQRSIRQWSETLLAIAHAHARVGNWTIAMQTAQLIPLDTPLFFSGQEAIAQWSQHLITQAQTQSETGQLQSAIHILQQIPPDTPDHEAAQRAIGQWRSQLKPAKPRR